MGRLRTGKEANGGWFPDLIYFPFPKARIKQEFDLFSFPESKNSIYFPFPKARTRSIFLSRKQEFDLFSFHESKNSKVWGICAWIYSLVLYVAATLFHFTTRISHPKPEKPSLETLSHQH
jgi:hypothetical protein